jgi:hypothetical protein
MKFTDTEAPTWEFYIAYLIMNQKALILQPK